VIERAATRPTPLRLLADQALSRAAGAPLVGGNRVRHLKDAAENFPAWLEAIAAAERSIFFESYIVGNDATGRSFRDALADRARAGVRVRVLHDWLGSPGKLSSRFWRPLLAAGGSVRSFNPPRFDSPLGWLTRDHRKSICVDGRVAFVAGLCVDAAWLGDPSKGKEPWRDTGLEIRGPGVCDVERAFAQSWAAAGPQLGNDELTDPASVAPEGGVPLRVVASAPATASLLRLDQLIASIARSRLWLADAYFVPLPAYVQTLRAAARDGVDVRLLVPGASDIPLLKPLSRSAYKPLLESGVRVFEWNGTMLHAKTAVADGRWSRVGSTNLNLASFIGNYELDVAVEDEAFAATMERQYRDDLTHATEIVLLRRRRSFRPAPALDERSHARRARSGSAGRVAAGAVRLGSAVSAAITRPRDITEHDGRIMGGAAIALTIVAGVAVAWPRAIAWPLALVALWLAASFLSRGWRGRRDARRQRSAR
jgi:cardiolipin synthase